MKILFQGDSITDAGRSYNGLNKIENLGHGYVKFVAMGLMEKYPDVSFDFINRGISGNCAENLLERWEEDAIEIQPDVASILIGVNDTWHRAVSRDWMPHDYFEDCYRKILIQLKEKTNAKIILLEQFQLDVPDKEFQRVDLDPKIQVTRKLAREFADVFIPLDGLFAAASVKKPPTHWADDGIHPTEEGAKFIAGHYINAISPYIM